MHTKNFSSGSWLLITGYIFCILIFLAGCQVSITDAPPTPTPRPENMFETNALGDGKTHLYQLFDTPLTWTQAREKAKSLGGHLATITMASEQSFIESILNNSQISSLDFYWLGGFQPAGSEEAAGNWQWVTGEAFADFTNWYTDQPNNSGTGGQQHLEIRKDMNYMWNDIQPAGSANGFICEWETPASLQKYTYDSHTYARFDISMTWDQAYDFATQLGGYLATVTSDSEESFIETLLPLGTKSKYWLGAFQYSTSVEPYECWTWVNNEHNFNYKNWAEGQPAIADNCLLIDKSTESVPLWYSSTRTVVLSDCGILIEWSAQ